MGNPLQRHRPGGPPTACARRLEEYLTLRAGTRFPTQFSTSPSQPGAGDDRFTTGFEPWRDWGRHEPPGQMHLYTYWMDMARDKDGHFWGNMLMPEAKDRVNPVRGRWYCYEIMVKANTVSAKTDADASPVNADGELAAWIDGKLYLHTTGVRWRASEAVKLKRFALSIYVHQSRKENRVWYDDVVLSTGYVGPEAEAGPGPGAPRP